MTRLEALLREWMPDLDDREIALLAAQMREAAAQDFMIEAKAVQE